MDLRTGLKICDRTRGEIGLVVRHAESNRNPLGETHLCFEGSSYICAVAAYQVCYSIEERLDGWARHIAIRDAEQGNIPHPDVVDHVLREFKFERTVTDNLSWLTGSTVHVVERIAV